MLSYFFTAMLAVLGIPFVLLALAVERHRKSRFNGKSPRASLRVAYLLTDSWVGAAGGAASHQIGFCKGLCALGHTPVALVGQVFPALSTAIENCYVVPAPAKPARLPLSFAVMANNWFCIRHGLRIFKRGTTDVVCQRQSQMNYSGTILSRALGIPFLLEYNSPATWKAAATDRRRGILIFLSRMIERINLSAAHRVLVVSEVLKQGLVERGIDPNKVIVNPNGADTDLFNPDIDGNPVRAKYNLTGKIVVGFAGVYRPWHGVEFLAKAARKIVDRCPNVQFFFVGDQGLVDLVSKIIAQDECLHAVTFATGVSHSQMPAHYAACDILVSPHVHMADGGTFFGSPIKIFEYMAMGKAIVASGVGQLSELLKDQESALLTPPGDISRIADAVVTLAANVDLRHKLGAAARSRCMETSTWTHNADRFIAAYRSVVAA